MKILAVSLATLVLLGLVPGFAGCDKGGPADNTADLIVSLSPAAGASSVAANSTITIRFRSPLWSTDFPIKPGGEPVQIDSSELADRFRVIDASNGEQVDGTISIEKGVELTFRLPPGASWKPDNTYWIEGTTGVSLEETYKEGAHQDLLLSEFTTQDLQAVQFTIHHPIGGSWPTLLNDVAYDVDTSKALSFEDLKSWIEDARSRAEGTGLSKFHFWPNIINLTDVYYWQNDHELFNDILIQLLENEPDDLQLQGQLTGQVSRGDRVFIARDFISSLMYGFKNYREIQYGLVINLDNPDLAGVRRPYLQEILVHEYGADGLPVLHDPYTEELNDIFNNPSSIGVGKAWDLCLRGNLKKSKYNAMVVDKLDEAPAAGFYSERVELTCGCDFIGDFDASAPAVPGKPKPPPHPEPEPVFERQPMPKLRPPGDPPRLLNPKPGPSGPSVEPWPFPVDPIPLPRPEAEEPAADGNARRGDSCLRSEPDCGDLAAVAARLNVVKAELEAAKASRRQDKNTFERFRYQYGWFLDMDKVKFNDPCLTKMLEKLVRDTAPLLNQSDSILADMGALWQEYKDKKEYMGGDPVLQTLARRDNLWSNMLEFRGEGSALWREVKEGCPILIPAGSFTDTRIIDLNELQGRFQEEIHAQMMNKGTWDKAVNSAVKSEYIYPEGYQQDSLLMVIWRGYADCMKRLHMQKLTNFLKDEFGNKLTPVQLQQMINVMFNGSSALSDTQRDKYEEIQRELGELKVKLEQKAAPRKDLLDKLDKQRQSFEARAWRCCFIKSRENILRLYQQQLILEAYQEWCNDPVSKEAIPLIPVYPEEYLPEESTWTDNPAYCNSMAQLRFCAMLCEIAESAGSANLKGLKDYAIWLRSCNCVGYKCEDITDPCDPACEVCIQKPPAATVPAVVSPVPTTPAMITMPPSDVIPPPAETAQPVAEVLGSEVRADAKSVRDEKGCGSTVTVSYSAWDITSGRYPVIRVVLTVNGQVWNDSGQVSMINYQNSISREVGCGQSLNILVTATNKAGQAATVTTSITTPVP